MINTNLMITVIGMAVQIQLVLADLPFNYTETVTECSNLDVTWLAQKNAFPYSVYIIPLGNSVQSWQIQEPDPSSDRLTFRYQIPKNGRYFKSFMISIVDSTGNGNTSKELMTYVNPQKSLSCGDYQSGRRFEFQSRSFETGDAFDRFQCGDIHYYPTFNNTVSPPLSISIIPVFAKPMTLIVPQDAIIVNGTGTYFDYTAQMPLIAGMQYYEFMSSKLGPGAGSRYYWTDLEVVNGVKDSKCLNGFNKTIDSDRSHALPVGNTTATFRDVNDPDLKELTGNIGYMIHSSNTNTTLPLDSTDKPNANDSSAEDIIGVSIGGVCACILLASLLYWLCCIRKKRLEKDKETNFMRLREGVNDSESYQMNQMYPVPPSRFPILENNNPAQQVYSDNWNQVAGLQMNTANQLLQDESAVFRGPFSGQYSSTNTDSQPNNGRNPQQFSFLHPRPTVPIAQVSINSLAHSSEAHGAEANAPIGESQIAKQDVEHSNENSASDSADVAMSRNVCVHSSSPERDQENTSTEPALVEDLPMRTDENVEQIQDNSQATNVEDVEEEIQVENPPRYSFTQESATEN